MHEEFRIDAALVTGGAGFVGSNFIRMLLAERPDVRIVNYDALTYAGNLENLAGIDEPERLRFVHGDIRDGARLLEALRADAIDTIFHFAAETHVDRSIIAPLPFIQTNVTGTLSVLEAARAAGTQRLVCDSTDEVYGSLGPTGRFNETSPLAPNNPYAASKAAADHLCWTWFHTYGVPVIVTRCCNNYGPRQLPEKLIPMMILRAMAGDSLPIYGDGMNARDWIHVDDHCRAVLAAAERGRPGERYNIAAENERLNIELVRLILKMLNRPESLIQLVPDRPGHDKRYAMDPSKAWRELGWRAVEDFISGLHKTIRWYLEHASQQGDRVSDDPSRGAQASFPDNAPAEPLPIVETSSTARASR